MLLRAVQTRLNGSLNAVLSATLCATLLLLSSVSANALTVNEVVPVIGGEVFDNIAIVKGDDKTTAVQYVRASENHKAWTKLVAYTNVRDEVIGDQPKEIATRYVKALQNMNPGARYQLSGNEEGTVLMLDFLAWPANEEYLEFSVYRMETGAAGDGVYTVQFTVRMPYFRDVTEEVTTAIQQLRAGLIQQMAKYNMKDVKQLLNDQRERNLGKTK